MPMDHRKYVFEIINLVRALIADNQSSAERTGKINTNGGESMAIDVKIENEVIEYIRSKKLPYRIFAEEGGDVEITDHPDYFVTFDPIDGSTNYAFGKGLLPYGFLMSVYGNLNPKLSDVVCAAAFEFTNNQAWIFSDGKTTEMQSNKPVEINVPITPDLHTPVYMDLYRKASYDFYSVIAEKVFI